MTMIGILERPRERPSSPVAVALSAIDRLVEIIRDETEALRDGARADLERSTHQKNIGLLELTRAMRLLPAGTHAFDLVSRLKDLRDILAENAGVLSLHLAAATEIADLVSTSIEEAASDGTYCVHSCRGAVK